MLTFENIGFTCDKGTIWQCSQYGIHQRGRQIPHWVDAFGDVSQPYTCIVVVGLHWGDCNVCLGFVSESGRLPRGHGSRSGTVEMELTRCFFVRVMVGCLRSALILFDVAEPTKNQLAIMDIVNSQQFDAFSCARMFSWVSVSTQSTRLR